MGAGPAGAIPVSVAGRRPARRRPESIRRARCTTRFRRFAEPSKGAVDVCPVRTVQTQGCHAAQPHRGAADVPVRRRGRRRQRLASRASGRHRARRCGPHRRGDGRVAGRAHHAGLRGLWNDAQAEAFAPSVAAIKAAGAVPGIQIAHAGRKASANRPWEGDDHIADGDPRGWQTIAPSAVPFGAHLPKTPRAMTRDDIARVQADFVAAAKRARDLGSNGSNCTSRTAISARASSRACEPA